MENVLVRLDTEILQPPLLEITTLLFIRKPGISFYGLSYCASLVFLTIFLKRIKFRYFNHIFGLDF